MWTFVIDSKKVWKVEHRCWPGTTSRGRGDSSDFVPARPSLSCYGLNYLSFHCVFVKSRTLETWRVVEGLCHGCNATGRNWKNINTFPKRLEVRKMYVILRLSLMTWSSIVRLVCTCIYVSLHIYSKYQPFGSISGQAQYDSMRYKHFEVRLFHPRVTSKDGSGGWC